MSTVASRAHLIARAREATDLELTLTLPCVSNAAIRRTADKIACAIGTEARFFIDGEGARTALYRRAVESASALASGDPAHLLAKVDAVRRLVRAAREEVDATRRARIGRHGAS